MKFDQADCPMIRVLEAYWQRHVKPLWLAATVGPTDDMAELEEMGTWASRLADNLEEVVTIKREPAETS